MTMLLYYSKSEELNLESRYMFRSQAETYVEQFFDQYDRSKIKNAYGRTITL